MENKQTKKKTTTRPTKELMPSAEKEFMLQKIITVKMNETFFLKSLDSGWSSNKMTNTDIGLVLYVFQRASRVK